MPSFKFIITLFYKSGFEMLQNKSVPPDLSSNAENRFASLFKNAAFMMNHSDDQKIDNRSDQDRNYSICSKTQNPDHSSLNSCRRMLANVGQIMFKKSIIVTKDEVQLFTPMDQ